MISLKKIKIIALREFKIRLRKKIFWIMSLIGPLVFGLLMIVPLWVTMDTKENKTVVVSNASDVIYKHLPKLSYVTYIQNEKHLEPFKFFNEDVHVVIGTEKINYFSRNPDEVLETILEQALISGLNDNQLIAPDFNVKYIKDADNGRAIKEALAYGMSILVYFFIFMYGVQVMKGVIEEKNNRIIEVMLCTVKPFELMCGKILGISWVGLVQFIMWLGFVYLIQSYVSSSFHFDAFSDDKLSQFNSINNRAIAFEVNSYLNVVSAMNWFLLLGVYLFFFYIGFLLYAALFAVIGAASDVDTDTQQFIFPLTVPLLGTMVMAQEIIANPFGKLAHILSFVPFTSLLAVPLRLPFISVLDNISLSLLFYMTILFVSFILIVWFSAKIYKINVLTSGGKFSFMNLFS